MPLRDDKNKYCGGCKSNLNIEKFSKSKYTKDNLSTQCKKCNGLRGTKWRKENPERNKRNLQKWIKLNHDKVKENRLKRYYGIDLKTFNLLWEKCSGKCEICKKKLIKIGRKSDSVHVDHNHETGEVRGLLCCQCNHGLGNFKDDKNLLIKAREYLCLH